MGDLGAIEADVVFDDGAADALITGCDNAATVIEGQAGSRASWAATGSTDFQGHFSELFAANALVASGDATELCTRLRQVATGARRLKEEARKEQERRQIARKWKHEHDNRSLWDQGVDFFTGGDDPPVGPPAEEPTIPVEPAPNRLRQNPPPGGGGGGGGGTSSARPSNLRTFATGSAGANDALAAKPGTLRAQYATFQARCRWGTLDASGVFVGFDKWLAANAADVTWATTVADAFKAAGGEGDISTVSDSALASALQAAGVSASRQDLTIAMPQAIGNPPTTGYADDPVNTATGNFVENETDLIFPGAASSLSLGRCYNSFSRTSGAFGLGWSSVLEAGLVFDVAEARARLVLPDGRQVHFPRLGSGWDRAVGENLWLETADGDAGPVGSGSAAADLLVTGNEGSWWRLAADGTLLGYGYGPADARAYVRLGRDAQGRVVRLEHARGAWIGVRWGAVDGTDRVVAATTSDGRRIDYGYARDDLLVSVSGPGGTRRYGWDADPADGPALITSVNDADGVVEAANVYDQRRRVVRQRSPYGRSTRFAYLPGRVTVVSDEDGTRSNTWICDERGRLVGVVDADDHRQSTSYDRHGNPVVITERDGATTVHAYDARGRRIRSVTPSGADLTFGYDALDRVTTVVAEEGAVTEYGYEGEQRNPSTVLDPEGGLTRLRWVDGLLTQTVDPTGVVVRFHQNDRGDLVGVTNADGATARLERDDLGRVTAAVTASGHRTTYGYDPVSGLLAERRNPDGATWRYEHTAAGRLSATTDPLGARTTLERGEHGDETATVDPLGRRISRRLDELGNLAEVTLPDGSPWHFAHDAQSRLTATTDATGGTWRAEHDANGRAVATTDPAGVRLGVDLDRTRNHVRVHDDDSSAATAFDPLGRLTAQQQPDGSAAICTYDRCGRPVEALDAEGGLTRIERDPAGRTVAVTSPTGGVTRYAYDRCGRLSAVTDPLGAVTTVGYDEDSYPVVQTLPTGESARTTYDACGRVSSHSAPGVGTTAYAYDLAGRVVRSHDPSLGQRDFRYDAAGQLVAVVDGNGGTTTYGYDANGRATTITSPVGAVTRREFDAMNRCVAETDPLGRTTRAGYDLAGRLSWQDTPDGRRTSWTYDAAGRPATMRIDGVLVTALTRDLRRRTVRVADHTDASRDAVVEHELEWNARGQLVRRARGGREVRWTYDAAGRRTGMTAPDGSTTTYTWDAADRLTAVEHSTLGRAAFDRDAAGRLVAAVAGGLVQSWRHVDGFVVGHVVSDGLRTTRTTLRQDADGRIAGVDRLVAGRSDSEESVVTDYAYDRAHQLVEARSRTASGQSTTRWTYDAAGRLLTESTDDATVHRVYDLAGQLLSELGPDGHRTTHTYDELGRRVGSYDDRGASRELVWNPSGYLAGVVRREGNRTRTTRVHADALGELASVDGAEYFWDTAAYAGAPVLAGDTPVLTAGPVTGVGADWTTPGWRTSRATAADPWATDAGSGPARLGAVGISSAGDVEIGGLEWMGARVYDASSRGFLSVDPLDPVTGAGWSGNPYSFAGNDPLHALDPAGLRPVTDAELQTYRDSNGIGGAYRAVSSAVGSALDATGNWLANNWEYVAGGAAIVAGIALTATGVGGPVGMMLISAGADTIIQKATTGSVNWGEVGVSFVAGAVGGGFAAAKLGATGLRAAVVSGAVSGAVGGAATGGYQYASGPGPHSVTGFLTATAQGGATGAAFGGLGGAAGHGIVTGAGRVLDNVHPTPPHPTPLNGADTVAKGERGVQASIDAAQGRGETVLGREITVDTGATRVRPDILVRDTDGNLKFIDSKNGPSADLTKNQKVGYPDLEANGGIPRGENARAAGLTPGVPIGPTPVQIDHWPSV